MWPFEGCATRLGMKFRCCKACGHVNAKEFVNDLPENVMVDVGTYTFSFWAYDLVVMRAVCWFISAFVAFSCHG